MLYVRKTLIYQAKGWYRAKYIHNWISKRLQKIKREMP